MWEACQAAWFKVTAGSVWGGRRAEPSKRRGHTANRSRGRGRQSTWGKARRRAGGTALYIGASVERDGQVWEARTTTQH